MLVVVDRIEGQFVVIEFPDRSTRDIPMSSLITGVKPGDCFWYKEGKFTPAPEEAERRRAEIARLTEKMWKD